MHSTCQRPSKKNNESDFKINRQNLVFQCFWWKSDMPQSWFDSKKIRFPKQRLDFPGLKGLDWYLRGLAGSSKSMHSTAPSASNFFVGNTKCIEKNVGSPQVHRKMLSDPPSASKNVVGSPKCIEKNVGSPQVHRKMLSDPPSASKKLLDHPKCIEKCCRIPQVHRKMLSDPPSASKNVVRSSKSLGIPQVYANI